MSSEIFLASPLLVISVLSIISVLFDAIWKGNSKIGYFFAILTLLLFGLSGVLTLIDSPATIIPTNKLDLLSRGMISFGGYASFFDILFAVAGLLTIFASGPYLRREYKELNEYYSMLLFSIVGMSIIAHTNHMVMLFIGIETMSISFYVLSGIIRTNIKSVEAALKYFLLGAFATGFLLYGMSLIYGSTGTMYLNEISAIFDKENILATIGLGLMIIGLSFKVAAFPFHQWAPDVYQGAPTVVTGFMSTAGKAAALIAFILTAKSMIPVFIPTGDIDVIIQKAPIQNIIAVIAAATMIIGNISALLQKNIKRMLAYSSVAHAGYLLMGIVANSREGWDGILFYTTAYMFMQIGAFVVVGIIERNNETNLGIEDYSGLYKKYPLLSAVMAIFMLSLAGIPPFAGFFGKYYLFIAAIESGFTWLTIVAVISSIISIYFYIGIIIYMYFKEPANDSLELTTGSASISLVISTIGVVFFGLFPTVLVDIARRAFGALVS